MSLPVTILNFKTKDIFVPAENLLRWNALARVESVNKVVALEMAGGCMQEHSTKIRGNDTYPPPLAVSERKDTTT